MNELSVQYAKEKGILADYLDYLYNSGTCSSSTAYNYYMTLRSLAKFLRHRRGNMECAPDEVILTPVSIQEMLSISADEWYAYLDYYEFRNKERSGSLSLRVIIIRGFYRWLSSSVGAKCISFVVFAPTSKSTYGSKKFIRVSELMEEHICASLQGEYLIRNACIVRLLVRYGLTLQEICNLNMEDVELKSLNVRSAPKGRINSAEEKKRTRSLPLDDVTISAINDYVAVRNPPKDGSNAFFVSATNGRLKRGALEKMLRKAVAEAGPEYMDITARDMQLTAKARMVEEKGVREAQSLSSVQSSYYFYKAFGQCTEQVERA